MQISSSRYGAIALTPLNSDNIPGPLLPGSSALFCEQDFGTMLIQEYKTDHFSIRYAIFNFFKKMTLLFKEEKTGIRSRLALNNSVTIKTKNKEKLQLKEGQFVLLNGDHTAKTIFFDKDREYRFFDTAYSVDLLNQLLASFPSIKDFIGDHVEGHRPDSKQPHFASAAMINIAYDILKCPYDENLRKFYFENKLRDFLFELLVQMYDTVPAADNSLSPADTSSVLKAKEFILNDLSRHFTIQQISRQVHLNEFKLKAGFKQQFGTGIFECLLQARMQKAREFLIETDKPIKEIASLTGYDFLTSFITAFRKYFGYTPGSIRRK
jgi:AraC-like DNA-binding protein